MAGDTPDSSGSSGEVLFTVQDHVALITLNRPEKLNAVNSAMRAQLMSAWSRVESDPEVRVAVLTGAGQRAFSAGRDLNEQTPPGQTLVSYLGDDINVTKPVIAAVNGLAYGGGWFLAQMCDLVVASETARFALPEAKVGLAPAWAVWLQGVIPQKVTLELLMTGNPITAARAYEIGFVNYVVPPEQVVTKSLQLAADIVACAPLVVTRVKEAVYATGGMERRDALNAATKLFDSLRQSEDAAEGSRAFREKRKPQWTGR